MAYAPKLFIDGYVSPGSDGDYHVIAGSYTAAEIADSGNAVNTTGKFTGKAVWDSTNSRVVIASGPLAGDAWEAASVFNRATESGDTRITEAGDTRILG